MTTPIYKLGDLVTIRKGKKALEVSEEPSEGFLRYIQIEDLRNNDSMKYARNPKGPICDGNDVLIAWDGAKAGTVGFGLSGLVGSTIAILRPNESVHAPYLGMVLQSKYQMIRDACTGATIPHVSKPFLQRMKIPLPSITEQKRVTSILKKVNSIKNTSLLIQNSRMRIIHSTFVEMFGDPVVNPHNYPKIPFEELGTLDRGKSKHRPRNDPRLLGGDHPLIQTGEIRSANLFVNTFTRTYSDFGLAQSRKWPVGTLAITIAANIAESAILGIESCFPDSIVGFTPNSDSNSIFIKAQLDFLKNRISEVAPQSAQKNINLKILREIPMICPPTEMQVQYAAIVQNTTKIFDAINKKSRIDDILKESLIQEMIT